eukprot:CAMPEP_0182577966 /NCGR_PEP_ID=MMETSP1324-20130603/39511_1 /TAXON_ID=236786 /ORGANISM="Florenciella sp., Strain RCC1587" /LENGTH=38 /DNA_ID= /DNA_START= /DNA_END= /DNA_ORIENTATION=
MRRATTLTLMAAGLLAPSEAWAPRNLAMAVPTPGGGAK